MAVVGAVAGCGGGDQPAAAGGWRVVRGDGIRYLLPGDWRAAAHSLTPQLSNPRQLLAAGTGPLPAGGECAHLPSAALRAMGTHDVLVNVQERLGSTATFPIRPAHFKATGDTRSEAIDCAGPRPAFPARRRLLGDEHPNTLTSMNNLAATLDALGEREPCH
jgi:hypothetical protein